MPSRPELPAGPYLVVGLARSGEAARTALEERGVEVVAADRSLGNDADVGLLDGVGALVKSPGVPGDAPLAAAARARGIPIWSEVELGARLFPNPLVGVTGTNGKTTTTELLGAIFRAAGRPVEVAGNVGRALTSLRPAPDAWLVCELSSFQLEDVETLRPRVGVLLNLEPDHLDRHGTFDAYRAAKLRLFENQGADDAAVLPRGFDPVPGEAARVEFAADDPLPAEPLIPGAHNRENAAAATAAARAAGIADDAIAEALRTFAGVPHRLELVAERGGVRFVNDSKATNTAAARRALTAYDAPLHLVLGGSLKGERFDAFAAAVAEANVVTAYLVGEAAEPLAAALGHASVPFRHCGTLERAVEEAARAARAGEIVLLSPACASYDQFSDFEQRGEEFRRLVENLAG
ncbi:MAG TPA: Mur ligase family protein [Gaiellaceae bacterium]|nr:Mur ligase family protein [Gaiellaceae bacterium]